MKQNVAAPGERTNLTRFAWLSIAAAIATIALKTGAYFLTGSVGLLSDAIESIVNLMGAVMALGMLTIAARPPDEDHRFGHSKAEYFSSVFEGMLILIAAGSIIWSSVQRLLNPQPLEQVGWGVGVSLLASVINLVVARVLLNAGKKNHSISLEADGNHLMTDVWTSVGVLGGVIMVAITRWLPLDSIVAIIVALNIVWTGYKLISRSISGLMDTSLPDEELKKVESTMSAYRKKGVDFHALRTRQAASSRFISVHFLVPGNWSVREAHQLAENFEKDCSAALGEAFITTHLEPIEEAKATHTTQ